eukprot:365847-Chlamydomonas_euryale.AAC.24
MPSDQLIGSVALPEGQGQKHAHVPECMRVCSIWMRDPERSRLCETEAGCPYTKHSSRPTTPAEVKTGQRPRQA